MTPEAINIAIAEWCGDVCQTCKGRTEDHDMECVGLPDYYHDLNACREAAMYLRKKLPFTYMDYAGELSRIVSFYNRDVKNSAATITAADATAPQRCEALLRALNLWKEVLP